MNYQDFSESVKNGTTKAVIMKDGQKLRLFYSKNNYPCYFLKRSSRRGLCFSETHFNNIKSIVLEKTQEHIDKANFKMLQKYKQLALKASFKNSFIDDCLKPPDSFEQWINDGKKDLYQYEITTGNRIDGKVISLKRIEKKFPFYIQQLRNAIQSQTSVNICSHEREFDGYDVSISTVKNEKGFYGYLSLEYKNCGNGYYYLLINDENFIGYDVD